MNHSHNRRHPIDNLFMIVLLGSFMVFLLMMLLFSAQACRSAVSGNQTNNNLYTASAYITAKFRQHDNIQDISVETLEDSPALCLKDTINGQSYITYIYLKDQHLKELFTATDNTPVTQMGTDIASLNAFQVIQEDNNFYHITLEDRQGSQSSLLLHAGF